MSEVKRVPKKSLLKDNYSSLTHATLKLFNALPVKSQDKKKPTKKITELTVNHGFVFSSQVFANYSEIELQSIIDAVSDEIGLTPAQMNSSFHKSWKKVRDAPIYQLVVEQIFHYITTYGYEALGVYDQDSVFIPNERLNLPSITGDIKLTIIKGYTKKQLKEKLLGLLGSGIALNNLDEIVEVAKYCDLTQDDVSSIRNKEVRIRLYTVMNILPVDPVEFLRLMVFKTTEKSLIIVNRKTIETIKASDADIVDSFIEYDERVGIRRLAEIFLRFKPLFLAFKSDDKAMRAIINRISRLSHKYHKPMQPSLLNNITGMLKRKERINIAKLDEELDRVNIFRKIRLAQSLNYRMTDSNSIMYKIRNGKSFATQMNFNNVEGARKMYNIIITSIAKDLKHLKGKEFYIPENVTYALPATAKQFTGNIPSGSYITVGKDMIFGVHWDNVKVGEDVKNDEYFGYSRYDTHDGRRRIDLDLHSMGIKSGHIGWNSSYRSGNRSVLFSGDITDASNGASELYYINKDYDDTLLLTLNYFNFDESVPVPFKIMVAEEHPNSFGNNYTINPNHMKCVVKSVIDVKQKVIGLGTVKDGVCRFYFSESALGNTIAVKGGENIELARDYLANFATTQITFNDVLEAVGAKIVTEPTKKSTDLSIESLESDTFIKLLTNK